MLVPNEPNLLGDLANIFGVHVLTNTKVPQGTAIVLDTAILANQYGDWAFEHNAWQFRAEERCTVGVIRPTAICTVTGINPGGG